MWDKEHQDIESVVILLVTAAPTSLLQLIQNLLLTRSFKALDKDLIPVIVDMIQKMDVMLLVQLIRAIQMDAGDPLWNAGVIEVDGGERNLLL